MYKLSRQNGVTALYVASRNGRVEVVNILLQNGAHVDVQDEVEVFIFHICSTDRAVKLKAMYVSQEHDCDVFIFIIVQDKWTPLMMASQNGHVDVVNVLLQHGASVHLQNKVNLHPLTFLFIKAPIICMNV